MSPASCFFSPSGDPDYINFCWIAMWHRIISSSKGVDAKIRVKHYGRILEARIRVLTDNQGDDHATVDENRECERRTVHSERIACRIDYLLDRKFFTYYNARASEKMSMMSIPTKSLF